MSQDTITNERMIGKFDNQFDLVNFAIKMAEYQVQGNRDAREYGDLNNPAIQVLHLIRNADQLEMVEYQLAEAASREQAHKKVESGHSEVLKEEEFLEEEGKRSSNKNKRNRKPTKEGKDKGK